MTAPLPSVPEFAAFRRQLAASPADLAGRALAQFGDVVAVKKAHVAVPKLARIFESALQISARKGFHAMSLRDLAAEADLSLGAIYSYIGSKETLLHMLLSVVHGMVDEVLGPTAGLPDDPRQRLAVLLARHVYLTEVMQPWFAFSYMEAKAFHKEARKAAIESELATEGMIAEVIEAGIAAGVYQCPDARMAAALIKPMLQDWYLKRWKYRRREVAVGDYAASVVAFAEAALRPRP